MKSSSALSWWSGRIGEPPRDGDELRVAKKYIDFQIAHPLDMKSDVVLIEPGQHGLRFRRRHGQHEQLTHALAELVKVLREQSDHWRPHLSWLSHAVTRASVSPDWLSSSIARPTNLPSRNAAERVKS